VVQIDHSGRLWLELGEGIGCYRISARGSRPSALTPLRYLEDGKELPGGGRLFFLIDAEDHLWISVLGVGVYHLDPSHAKLIRDYFGAPQDLASNDIRAMLEDRDGSIWLGGVQGGITVVRDPHSPTPSIVRYGIQDGLSDDGIRAFAEDAEGKIWVGTRVGGVGVFHHGGFRNLTMADGLEAQTVWSLAYDPAQDIIWAGTSVGVEPVEAQTLRPLPVPGQLRGSGVTGVGLLAPGYLWSASADGLVLCEYARERVTTTPPPVFMSGVTVQGEDVPATEAGEFSYAQRSIRFDFHGITFRDPAGLRFSYRLRGLNHAWSNLTPQTSIAYASLPAGGYRFEVRATTSEGVTSPLPATYSFEISSPLWQKTWFLGFSLASLAAAGSFAARLRIRGVRKQQRLQQEFSRSLLLSQEQERSRIARELHDSLVQLLIVMKNRALVGLRVAENGAGRELEEISSTASGAIEEVRRIAHNLRPYQLDRLGLTLAVEGLVRTMNETSGVRFSANIDDLDTCFSAEERILLFRIVQEAITNILKHAAATEAEVRILRRAGEARILVRDNGKGVEAEHGFGLRGIEQRATMLGGHLQVESSAGAGTTILVTIPCKGEQ
jgi:signal transduction histidine kinase